MSLSNWSADWSRSAPKYSGKSLKAITHFCLHSGYASNRLPKGGSSFSSVVCLFECLFVVVLTYGTLALVFKARLHSAQHEYCSPIAEVRLQPMGNAQTKSNPTLGWLVGWWVYVGCSAVQLFGCLAV
jgi:hypothetical protein